MNKKQIELLSVIIPVRDEEGCIESSVVKLHEELIGNNIPHEIVAVDDGSTDRTWEILLSARVRVPALRPVKNPGPFGFGRAVVRGLESMKGDAAVIMMADGSDDPGDVVRYREELRKGYDCVFGSRFVRGSSLEGYPLLKLVLNRAANTFLRVMFGFGYNDTTNAFKAYRREVIAGCVPFVSADFSITVELPLKAFVRGYSWSVIPVSWRGRKAGESKLRLKEMGSRYLSVCVYVWLEKYLSRGFMAGRKPGL